MELLGTGLGVMTAILWGSADVIASMATRRLGTFKTTYVSLSAGFLALFSFGVIAFAFLHLPFTQAALAFSMLIGIFTGIFAAAGYFYAYRALEAGPIALVSPLTSTSSVFTLLLAFFILRQGLTLVQIGAVATCILGILLASTNPKEVRSLLRTPGFTFFDKRVRWAIIAALSFSAVDVGIATSAAVAGWFLPALWTHIFSICFLTLVSYWRRRQRKQRFQMASRTRPHPEEPGSTVKVTPVTPPVSSTSPMEIQGGITTGDPAATLVPRSSRRRGPLASYDPAATLVPRSSRRRGPLASYDPEATLVPRPSRCSDALASEYTTSPMLKLLETSSNDTLVIRPFRSHSTMLTFAGDADLQRRMELSRIDTLLLPRDAAPPSPLRAREALASNPTMRTLSLSLPSLRELSHLRMPLASTLGMGVLLAIIAGIAETAAILIFSMNTRIAPTGIAAAIASGYSLVTILFGISIYRERLARNQIGGIVLFVSGLVLLAFIK